MDPSTLSLADIQKKIHDIDPSMFRQVMKDLKYDGEDPVWAKFDFMERICMEGKDNFFEKRVSTYAKAGVGKKAEEMTFSTEEDF